MRIFTFIGISFIFLLSCKEKPSANGKLANNITEEKFAEFFEKFKSDSLFQVERVKFPWTIPSKTGREMSINQSEWEHANFHYQEDFATRSTDAYKQEIITNGDTVKLVQNGVGNGLHIEFVFAKFQGKWFLCYEKDLSK